MRSSGPILRRFVPLAILAIVSLVALRAGGAEAKIAPEAQKAIDQFSKYYAGLKGFSVTVNIDLNVEQQGQKQNVKFVQKLAAERPDKFSYVYDGQVGGASVVSNGKEMSVFIKGFEKYSVEEAPKSISDIASNPLVMGILGMGNAGPITSALLNDDPAKSLLAKADAVEYGGTVELGEAKCHLIKATGKEMDWQLWIDAGDKPLVRQFVPDLTKAFEQMAKARGGKSPLANLKVMNTVRYDDWDVDPKFAADAFVFKAPEGAEKVDSLMEMLTGGAKPKEAEPHALLGKPAPPIDLELLDGGKLDLASFKDKNVVILDFWATWCGPCVQAMPIIDKVAEKFKDKGVRLFAVNLQEKPDEIQTFLKEAELKVDVALDKEGSVAAAYLANAIPQTVLVGKDGSVQVVKIGVSPDLEESLTGDLEALVAGKNLAAETLAKAKTKKEADAKAKAPAPAPKDDENAKDGK
jgi:thiol-disulfide isomerase/thioredoxin